MNDDRIDGRTFPDLIAEWLEGPIPGEANSFARLTMIRTELFFFLRCPDSIRCPKAKPRY